MGGGCSTLIQEASQKDFWKDVSQSSCAEPYVLVRPAKILEDERLKDYDVDLGLLSASLDEKYKAKRADRKTCSLQDVQSFIIEETDEDASLQKTEPVFIYFVSAEDLQTNPNVRCYQKSRQIYQPPLKSGGAGKVLNVADGRECKFLGGNVE